MYRGLVAINQLKGAFILLGVLRDVTTHFIVDARTLKKAGGTHIKVHVINPSGTKTESYITDKGDGTYRVEYTAFEDGRRKQLHHFLIAGRSKATDSEPQ